MLINLVPYLRPLYRGSLKVKKHLPQWTSSCCGYLNSAINGGQWPQVKKAKLPLFEGTDLCQLCLASKGTLAHRHECPASRPAAGWTPLDDKAKCFLDTLSEHRACTLQTRGVLTVSIPIAAPQIPTCGWRWISQPPDPQQLQGLTWVIDGSRRYAADWTLSTTGCGVAVLGLEGELLAYATATPPPWVKTAGAAEAWALLLTLRENPVRAHGLHGPAACR